jgi:hypothetical protein
LISTFYQLQVLYFTQGFMTLNEALSQTSTALPVFYRTYSRTKKDGTKESWLEMNRRTVKGLVELGRLTEEEKILIYEQQVQLKAVASGRWWWVGGTEWIKDPKNFSGAYNCTSLEVKDFNIFGELMNLAMMGCGTGAVLEPQFINQLPPIKNHLTIELIGKPGDRKADWRHQETEIEFEFQEAFASILVGDSREGWVDAYQGLIELAADPMFDGDVRVVVNLSSVRPAGEPLKGFGGTANPIKLPDLFIRSANILNKAVGRQLTALECCLLIDEAASTVVAGNIRRSAGMRQGASSDKEFAAAKDNLWQEGDDGVWRIDPERDALRMANHTRVFHHKPTEEECIEAVRKQFYSGEGAIQYAPEAIARANQDLFSNPQKPLEKKAFIQAYESGAAYQKLLSLPGMTEEEVHHRLNRYGLNPCLRGDMKLLTVDGYKTFEELEGLEVFIVNAEGRASLSKVWCSGEKEIVEMVLSDGSSIFCTPDHRWMTILGEREARDCQGLLLIQYLRHWKTKDVSVEFVKPAGTAKVYDFTEPLTHWGVVEGFVSHNCGEIISSNFHCNLSSVHLNNLNPFRLEDHKKAFVAAGLSAAILLNHQFENPRHQKSRELDPIVGVSFTGLFDFFVNAFGVDWLRWWQAGRPEEWGQPVDLMTQSYSRFQLFNDVPHDTTWDYQSCFYQDIERSYLEFWKRIVELAVWGYCQKHQLKWPNRCTTVKPEGTQSLLSGASPGWHPPKAQRFIRRITFAKSDPVALACMDYGYSVVPSQSDKDEEGRLLDDPFDPRCTEWLVEIPIEVPWANLPGTDEIEIEKFSALAQFDFYMQVQKYYVGHNASATIELTEEEIEPLGKRIYQAIQNDEGYVSSCLLARFTAPFPRLPYEKISKSVYEEECKKVLERRARAFEDALEFYLNHAKELSLELDPQGPVGCDSDKCLLPNQG